MEIQLEDGAGLAALFGAMAQANDDQQPALAGDDAIAALRAGASTYHAVHTFDPGDLLQLRDIETGSVTPRGGNPSIFLHYIEPHEASWDPVSRGAPAHFVLKPDCVIGWINRDGGFQASVALSRSYEPYDPELKPRP